MVHPSDFRVQRAETGEDGVVHEWDDELAGESWPGGPVVLSWEALDDSGSVAEGGANVVIHEFAHKLDMKSGEADGVPPLPTREARERWIEVFDAEFERFCADLDAGRQTCLDPYAAEHEAEFFAVASEAFFESPNALKREFPKLYELFRASTSRTRRSGSVLSMPMRRRMSVCTLYSRQRSVRSASPGR